MNLVIVESPTKARTLGRFLGDGYQVEASYGHVRDLPTKTIGIKIEQESKRVEEWKFEPEYVQTVKQKQRTEEIKKLSDRADRIILATDPDREGEAIAWHVGQILSTKQEALSRVVFHEITDRAIHEAMQHPGKMNMQLVDAQQARRVVDRLVGYKLSPLLWRKVRRGLSAGRVQSVAVRLVVEREKEIGAFVPEEYWVLMVELQSNKPAEKQSFWVTLVEKNGGKMKVGNQQEAETVENDLRQSQYAVDKIEEKEFRRTPPPPFTTSTMQQVGANRLGWSAKRTMQIAQALYEQGYITYHRTDSTNLAVEAVRAAAEYIRREYGNNYALDIPRFYKTKSKLSQEAHEAVRPTDVTRSPAGGIAGSGRDEVRLYELIWKRFMACQMAEARGVSKKIMVAAQRQSGTEAEYKLEAKGETVKFDGWLRVNQENGDMATNGEKLPDLHEGEGLGFKDLKSEQKFTQPPPRYSDASLIKALEEKGIGRPSTYAPTLSTIQDRQYVEKEDKKYKPTALGMAVNDFLVTNFPAIVDYEFTAKMENDLDEIANGAKEWQPVVGEFYGPFEDKLGTVAETAKRVQVKVEETGETCPKCKEGRQIIRIGRFGKFLACSRYPDCDFKANFVNKIGINCPKCGGDVVLKRTKTRKSFYGCSNYPKCDFASWSKPKSDKIGS